jgi:hypothetical protein
MDSSSPLAGTISLTAMKRRGHAGSATDAVVPAATLRNTAASFGPWICSE